MCCSFLRSLSGGVVHGLLSVIHELQNTGKKENERSTIFIKKLYIPGSVRKNKQITDDSFSIVLQQCSAHLNFILMQVSLLLGNRINN